MKLLTGLWEPYVPITVTCVLTIRLLGQKVKWGPKWPVNGLLGPIWELVNHCKIINLRGSKRGTGWIISACFNQNRIPVCQIREFGGYYFRCY